MNWMIRLGQWWENRRKAYQHDFDIVAKVVGDHSDQILWSSAKIGELEKAVMKLQDEMKLPSSTAKELSLIKIRLDKMELYVGLKREPTAVTLPGEARIS
jgi:hypothetical protein